MRLNDLIHVCLPGGHEFLAGGLVCRTRGANFFTARQFGRFTETKRCTLRVELIDQFTNGRVRRNTGRGIGFTAFRCDPKRAELTFFASQLGRPMNELFRFARRVPDCVVITILFNGKALDRFPGCFDAVNDLGGPFWLDADHDDSGHVRVAAGTDHGAKVQIKVFTKLQTPVSVRQGHGAFDVVRNGLTGGV